MLHYKWPYKYLWAISHFSTVPIRYQKSTPFFLLNKRGTEPFTGSVPMDILNTANMAAIFINKDNTYFNKTMYSIIIEPYTLMYIPKQYLTCVTSDAAHRFRPITIAFPESR